MDGRCRNKDYKKASYHKNVKLKCSYYFVTIAKRNSYIYFYKLERIKKKMYDASFKIIIFGDSIAEKEALTERFLTKEVIEK